MEKQNPTSKNCNPFTQGIGMVHSTPPVIVNSLLLQTYLPEASLHETTPSSISES